MEASSKADQANELSEGGLENGENRSQNRGNTPRKSIKLVSYPKIIFFYPTALVSLLCALIMFFSGADGGNRVVIENPPTPTLSTEDQTPSASSEADSDQVAPSANSKNEEAETAPEKPAVAANPAAVGHSPVSAFCGRLFMFVLFLNLVVIGFDFPRTTSLTLFFGVSAVLAIIYALARSYSWVMPAMLSTIFSVAPTASTSFYFVFFIGLSLLFLAVWVTRRFDYWEVQGNELLHHQGILSNMERYPSPNLRIDKEINDVFEYLLLRSGRLILHPSSERKSVILENVISISAKEEQISTMLRQLDVRVRSTNEH